MKESKLKNLIIFAAILLCGVLASCPSNGPEEPPNTIVVDWEWEVQDDKNPNKFAPGISTLFGYHYEDVNGRKFETLEDILATYPNDADLPDAEKKIRYSQEYELETPYVRGEVDTGWYAKEQVGNWTRVKTKNARGYAPTPELDTPEASETWISRKGAGDLIPLKVPTLEKTEGPDGTEVDAFHFWGTMVQKGSESDNSDDWVPRWGNAPASGSANEGAINTRPITRIDDYRLGAGWPVIAFMATPPGPDRDPEQKIRKAFMEAYGYRFWVKPMKALSNSYRTSVENWDYRPNEGHEPGYWYGRSPGRDGTIGENFTPAPVGEWTQVTVIYDPHCLPKYGDFNMKVNNWIYSYDIRTNYPSDPEPYDTILNQDKSHSIRINFSLQLQHNGGNEGEGLIEYSVNTGKHEYELYFYGLELLQY